MPLRDNDDIHNRLRSVRGSSPRSGMVNDFQATAAAARRFPSVGMTLPPQRPVVRPQQPSAATLRPRQTGSRPVATSIAATAPLVAPAPLPRAVPQAARKPKKKRRLITRKRIALVLAFAVLVGGAWFGTKMVSNVQKVFRGSIFSVLTTSKLQGEDTGRVNILLAGNSADDPGHDGANLTDSIMLISLDTKQHTAYLLSIPRDLWVHIPGYGHAKINEAYVDGEAGSFSDPGYFNGGMGLLQETVEQTLGVKADYYALIDYNALRDGVNAVGGVDVTIQSSDPRGLYDPSIDWSTHGPLVKLKNGVQHLDGREALDLARARGDAYGSYGFPRSDFDRTEHQRMMIVALKDKALSAGTLSNPVTLGKLFDSLGKNVKTNFSLSEVRRLYDLGKAMSNNSIQSVGLNDAHGVNLLASYTSPTNQSALIPAAGLDDFTKIQTFVTRLTTNDPLANENATIVVLNGTKTVGLAAQTQTILAKKSLTVGAIGDAAAPTSTTTIIDAANGQKPATIALLKTIFGANTVVTTTNAYANQYNADLIVVVGSDWTPPASAATAPSQ